QLNATEGVSAVTGISTLAPGEGASELFTDKFAICLPRGSRAKKLVLPEMASRLRSTPKALSLSASDHTGTGGPKFEDTLGNGDDTGMLWWGASIPRSRKFAINTPVIGVRHWTIGVKSVQVVDSSRKGNPVLTSFCDGKSPCAALVDSTSLFALPVPRVKEIFSSLGDLKLDCSNVQDLPDIQIAVGDSEHPLVITPESYVMKVQAHDLPLYEALGQSLLLAGDLQQVKRTAKPNVTLCLPAFMASPVSKGTVKDMPSYVQTGDHLTEMMILGIPIFREYTVMFDRQSSVIAFDRNPDESVSCSSTTPPTSLLHQGRTTRNGGRPLTIRDMPPPDSLVFPSGLDSLRMMTPPSSPPCIIGVTTVICIPCYTYRECLFDTVLKSSLWFCYFFRVVVARLHLGCSAPIPTPPSVVLQIALGTSEAPKLAHFACYYGSPHCSITLHSAQVGANRTLHGIAHSSGPVEQAFTSIGELLPLPDGGSLMVASPKPLPHTGRASCSSGLVYTAVHPSGHVRSLRLLDGRNRRRQEVWTILVHAHSNASRQYYPRTFAPYPYPFRDDAV
ncbi:hypothetical protein FOZ62_032037, partial [Perkinsus olseni]